MNLGKLVKFKWIDGLLILGILLVMAGIGMNFKDSFWEKAEVKLTASKTSHLDGQITSQITNDGQGDSKVMIDVGGEVIKPGVYELKSGDRINDVLVVAGGLSAKADRDWVEKNLNKAEKLVDGQKIFIPRQQLTQLGGQAKVDSVLGVVNNEAKIVRINTATLEQLDILSGVGPSIAQKIIDYRTKNGGFKNIEELKLVSGIGDKLFEKIKDEIAL